MTPSQIVHRIHGSEPRDECGPASGRCWLCAGKVTRGVPVHKWNGASFTGQNRVRCPSAEYVCEGCVFVCSRTVPVLGRPPKPDKKLGGNFRNYSHLYECGWSNPEFGEDGPACLCYANASKGDKPLIREFLRRHHCGTWFAAIADSGQKHVIPWVPLNPNGGTVGGMILFDEELIRVPDDQSVIDEATELLTLGVTKDEILRGEYSPRLRLVLRKEIDSFEEHHGSERNSGWFALAIWLSQREEDRHAEIKRARIDRSKTTKNDRAGKTDRRVSARCKERVPEDGQRQATAKLLADDRVSGKGSRATDGQRKRLGGKGPARDEDPRNGQLQLIDFD